MDEQQLRRDSELENRKQLMLDIEDGKKSIYWKHLERQIKLWIEAERKQLEKFDLMLIEMEDRKALLERNLCLERKRTLERLLDINNIIIQKNKNWIDNTLSAIQSAAKYVYQKTFVGT